MHSTCLRRCCAAASSQHCCRLAFLWQQRQPPLQACSTQTGSSRTHHPSFACTAAASPNSQRDSFSTSSSSAASAPRRPPSGSEISSPNNPYIKHCVKLRDSARYRQQQRRLLVAGSTLLTELADASPGGSLQAVALFLKPGEAPPAGISYGSVITVTDSIMRKLTGLEETAAVAVAAELPMPPMVQLLQQQQQRQQQQQQSQQQPDQQHHHQQQQQHSDLPQLQRLLVLEGVQDPGNLGTLLRCAVAFGWDAVWLMPGCCDPFNDKALRASRGAGFKVPLAGGTLEKLLQVVEQRGMALLAAEPDPEAEAPAVNAAGSNGSSNGSSSDGSSSSRSRSDGRSQGQGAEAEEAPSSRRQPVALVLGSEGSGLSAEVLAVAQPLTVPMGGDMESLNVGVAGSILMFCLSDGWSQLTGRLQQLRLLP